ncbi:MAG TPA: DUF2806 domain-containing protein [Acidocella sp.]|jgi:hypothetical protein|uniref:DUF2806 domain-containing protein n=1 Tax=Acidocella sp. TaxID=50710 RepID=UPI002C46A22D|nr:DUF2806 domain-containing protein [Acidocella sp.]HVE22669.1 DUF2806 domain-containing protein [Acidocella sp.]
MTDNNENDPTTNFVEVLEQALEGGLLRLVAGKPVQQAIGRLLYGAVDVPVAYLEGWAQRRRSDNIAEKKIAAAVADKAKLFASADQNLVQRGLDRWTRKFEARQKSIEDVAIRTIGILNEEHLPPDAAAPTEEFMRMFEDMAERATTEAIADLLARVLAGEIRKPLSVSRRTLQTVAVMDQELVQAMQYLRERLFEPNWTYYPEGDGEFARYADILESVSIARSANLVPWKADAHGDIKLKMGDKLLIAVSVPNNQFFVGTLSLTPIGRELSDLFPSSTQEKFQEIALGLKLLEQIARVDICEIELKDGRLYQRNRRALVP